jgi:hypothetical protein
MLNLLVWWRVMHKFKIGERLFPARSVGFSVPDGAYVVVKRLPMRDGEFEYQIKSLTEPDERVVCESQLRSNPWRSLLVCFHCPIGLGRFDFHRGDGHSQNQHSMRTYFGMDSIDRRVEARNHHRQRTR